MVDCIKTKSVCSEGYCLDWLFAKITKSIVHVRIAYRKKGLNNLLKPFIFVVRQAGFEPAAYGFVVRRSIRAELLAHGKTD